ncbi:iron-containing alcohol dehydrogenase [Catalinimonas alkaloidigena]|nr:iron-containing alcohol dehydrogenase [Catalinimonas alkaloidigena]
MMPLSIPNLSISFPAKVVFGNGTFAQLPDELQRFLCRRVLFVTIEPLLSQVEPLVQKLEQQGIGAAIDTSIVQEPTFADYETVLQAAQTFDPDVVVGIGGGSVLDVAKLVAAQLDGEQTLPEIVGIGNLAGRRRKLICLPATAGTGSEVSPNAILVDGSDHQKKGIISPYLVPDVVLVDPLLTRSVPPAVTAATGLDALTHCLEAYTNKFAHPFVDLWALDGVRRIAGHLVRAVQRGDDEQARSEVAMGSMLGGFCLGPVNTAGVHALSYPLGSTFHIAHGLSNALLLPHVMHFNLSASPERHAEIAVALGCAREADLTATAKKGIAKVYELMAACGVPSRLRDLDIPEDALPQMATDAMKITRLLKNNPRHIGYEDAVAIYEAAY